MAKKKESKKSKVLNYLRSGKSITPLEALRKFGSFRLADIIFTLKQEGLKIKSELVFKKEVRYSKYTLIK